MALPPAAFLSYSHHDEEHSRGFVSGFRQLLAAEVESALGYPIEIFFDRDSIEWGDSWRARIKQGIDQSSFLIAFVTPKFLDSEECRRELDAFRGVERARGREDLILAVNFIDVPELREPDHARNGEIGQVARLLAERQAADFVRFRDRSPSSKRVKPEIRKLAESLVRRIRSSRPPGGSSSRPPPDVLRYPLPDFVPRKVRGREDTIGELTGALDEPGTVLVALVGDSGIGKTAVATQVARDLQARDSKRSVAVRYLAARGYPPVNVESFLSALAAAIPVGTDDGPADSSRATPLERLDLVLRGLADRRVLIVLDDAGDLVDTDGKLHDRALAALLEDLAQQETHGVQVLLVTAVTPRLRSLQAVSMTKGLSGQGFRGFLQELGAAALVPPSERERLARVTGRWPRPVELVHGVVAGRRLSVSEVLDAVDEGDTLVHSTVEGFDERELAVLQLLAICDRPLPVAMVDELTELDAGDVLAGLAERRIVRLSARGDEPSYQLPAARSWPIAGAGVDLQRRAAEYFEARCELIVDENVRLDELGCYFDAIELYLAGGDGETALRLVLDLDEKYLSGRGQTPVLVPYLEQLADMLTAAHSKMETALIRARALVLQGDPGGSIPFARQALAFAEASCDTGSALIALSQIGNGYFEDGRVSEAATWHSLIVERGAGRRSRADAYLDLACCHLEIGSPRTALESLADARRELRGRQFRMDRGDRALEAKILLMEALIAFDLDEGSCGRIADEAWSASQLAGDELDAARCMDVKAWALLRQGKSVDAGKTAESAFAVVGRTGDPILSRIVGTTVAVLHLLNNEVEAGCRAADVAVRSSRSHPAAGALAVRGVAEFRRKKSWRAEDWFRRAKTLAGEACDKEPLNYAAYEALGLALSGLALVDDRSGSDEAAANAYREAVRLGDLTGAAFRRRCMFNALIGGSQSEVLPQVREVLGL